MTEIRQELVDLNNQAIAQKMLLDAKLQEAQGYALLRQGPAVIQTREQAHTLLDAYLDTVTLAMFKLRESAGK